MATHTNFLLALLLLLGSVCVISTAAANVKPSAYDPVYLNRSSFPAGFVFGTAGSAYQYEGAAFEGGKGLSIWDNFTHQYPEKIADRSNGDVADDSYHRYKEDVAVLKEMNMDAYRFSISWPRILPNGKLSGGVNEKGVNYYNDLINELLANGIQPYATLFHWDTPQTLEDEYGGFLSPRIVKDFQDFAEVCFKEFGDRVKHWITLNEPSTYCSNGYATGSLAPGRCSDWQKLNCTGGDSATEPYLVAHYQLLAHAAAGRLYKKKYQKTQKGQIGITLSSIWTIPYTSAQKDVDAAERALDFSFGWFIGPITNGQYPNSMSRLVGNRLPNFTKLESVALKASYDFVGINYYTTYYIADNPQQGALNKSATTDSHTQFLTSRNEVPIGEQAGSEWLYVYPKGFRDLLIYIKKKYNNPIIYITENGVSEKNNPKLPLKKALSDPKRIQYHYHHFYFLRAAIKDGVRVKGYFAWSLLDNFEWNVGYTVRFGINYIDYNDGLKRYPKLSARWFKKFLHK